MSGKNNGSRGISFLTPCRVVTSFLILFLLVGIGAAAWAVVTFLIKPEETGLYDVQVNSADQRLSVFDRTQGRWRSVCSSSSNELLANISCEEMGFIRAVNHSVYSILDGINNSGDFFCVGVEELTYGKKIREFLSPWSLVQPQPQHICGSLNKAFDPPCPSSLGTTTGGCPSQPSLLSWTATWTSNCESGLILRVHCQDCGRRSLTEDRIVGGLDARQGSWPWQVSLQYDGVHQCGGSIISDRWIVSAAHCFPERYRHVARWRVLLGSIYKAHTHSSVQTAEVQTVVFHSSYLPFVDPNVDDNSRDIAVLALTSRLQFTEYIQPVCLPTYGQRLIDGQMGTVTGWGNTEYYGQPSDVLQEANVPIISDAICNAPDYYDNQITTSMFCAGYEKGGTDACQGDSGGPFVSEDTLSKASRYRLLGVVSWGTGCAMAKKPGVYTKVSRFLPWISSAMRTFENVPGVHKMSRT